MVQWELISGKIKSDTYISKNSDCFLFVFTVIPAAEIIL